MYVNDLIICSESLQQCHIDLVTILQGLAKGGHKNSQMKLQYCQPEVEYLSRILKHGMKSISPSQMEAITLVPGPQTVRQIITFLCMTGYSADWIPDYTPVTAPLWSLSKDADTTVLQAEATFDNFKQLMQQAPTLALPDYKYFIFLHPIGSNMTPITNW